MGSGAGRVRSMVSSLCTCMRTAVKCCAAEGGEETLAPRCIVAFLLAPLVVSASSLSSWLGLWPPPELSLEFCGKSAELPVEMAGVLSSLCAAVARFWEVKGGEDSELPRVVGSMFAPVPLVVPVSSLSLEV